MSVSLTIPSKLIAVMLIIVILIVATSFAIANHNEHIIHACIKNGSIQVVEAGEGCKNDATNARAWQSS